MSESLAVDLDALEKRLRGDHQAWACDHYDIQDHPQDSIFRQCVLDSGHPENCEFSSAENKDRVTERDTCPYWRLITFTKPAPLTIEEGLALIAALRASKAEALPVPAEGDA